jgi:hypothetical protein
MSNSCHYYRANSQTGTSASFKIWFNTVKMPFTFSQGVFLPFQENTWNISSKLPKGSFWSKLRPSLRLVLGLVVWSTPEFDSLYLTNSSSCNVIAVIAGMLQGATVSFYMSLHSTLAAWRPDRSAAHVWFALAYALRQNPFKIDFQRTCQSQHLSNMGGLDTMYRGAPYVCCWGIYINNQDDWCWLYGGFWLVYPMVSRDLLVCVCWVQPLTNWKRFEAHLRIGPVVSDEQNTRPDIIG